MIISYDYACELYQMRVRFSTGRWFGSLSGFIISWWIKEETLLYQCKKDMCAAIVTNKTWVVGITTIARIACGASMWMS